MTIYRKLALFALIAATLLYAATRANAPQPDPNAPKTLNCAYFHDSCITPAEMPNDALADASHSMIRYCTHRSLIAEIRIDTDDAEITANCTTFRFTHN